MEAVDSARCFAMSASSTSAMLRQTAFLELAGRNRTMPQNLVGKGPEHLGVSCARLNE